MNTHVLLKSLILPILLVGSVVTVGCGGEGGNPLSPSGTVTVDRSGAGNFTSIQAAIDASPPGTMIQVGPGTFDGRLVVDKSLTIVGAGSSTVVEMSGLPKVDDPAETLDTEMDLLEIRDTADLVVENMVFSGGPDDGIVIRNSTNITLINVTASNNGDDGLDIRASSNITVTGSTFSGNGDKGVRVRDNSMDVSIQTSMMNDNGGKGVRIRNSNTSTIRDSTVSANGDDGIRVVDANGIEILSNTIMNNAECGIRVENTPNIVFQNNTVSGNGSDVIPCPK